MNQLDPKQTKLISTWWKRSSDDSFDAYSKFMSLWIAFNACCYALFHERANQPRADIKRWQQLPSSDPITSTVEITPTESAVRLDIDLNSLQLRNISLKIRQRYSESHVFDEFDKHFSNSYNETLKCHSDHRHHLAAFRKALTKENGVYVLNLSTGNDVSMLTNEQIQHSANRTNDYVLLPDSATLGQLRKVLYQIRCNIFHGEKVPGDINDDHIVKEAIPLLRDVFHLAWKPEP